MGIQDDIESFCGYFSGQLKTICQLQIEPDEKRDPSQHQIRFYRKVLLINSVDTLAAIRFAKARYPQLQRQNQERFLRFLQEGKCWAAGEYVSLPFLGERRKSGEIGPGRLRDLIDTKLARIDPDAGGSTEFHEIDEPISVLAKLATTEQEEKALQECQHYRLLYRYRNYLVHGSREPGTSMEINPDKATPYYHGYVGDPKLYLSYPERMFAEIMNKSVKYIKKYLQSNSLNPYDFVEETSRW